MAVEPFRGPLFSVESLEEIDRPVPPAPASSSQDHAVGALMLGLKALSQGTIIAFSRLTNLAMVASVFWLFMSIPNPTQFQIIWGGMYASFILVLAYLINRGRR